MKDSELRREDWERFFNWLNPNRDLAAREYEVIRGRLISYFNKRNCAVAEDLTDCAIDRVIRLLPSVIGQFSGQPIRYCFGVARYIHKEHLRREAETDGGTITEARSDPHQDSFAEEQEVMDRCLDHCLRKLDAWKRETFIRYYLVEKQTKSHFRQGLAEQSGMTINALRLQMLRLKEELRQCITDCRQRETAR